MTRPSITAVTLGGRTANRLASADDTAEPSSKRPSIRYWESDRSTSARLSSTCLASQAAVRPTLRRPRACSSSSRVIIVRVSNIVGGRVRCPEGRLRRRHHPVPAAGAPVPARASGPWTRPWRPGLPVVRDPPRRDTGGKTGEVLMKTRAAVCRGLGEPWTVEEIDIDEPHAHEVQVEMAYAGLCHSDEHLRTGRHHGAARGAGDLRHRFDVPGGRRPRGVGCGHGRRPRGHRRWRSGTASPTAFIPACGICFWCASGRQYLCDLGISTLAGPMISDGTWRYHLGGAAPEPDDPARHVRRDHGGHEASLVKIPADPPLKAAALISCGISTGFGSVVDRAKAKPGEVVVVVGCGGVGSGAIQGARIAGARAGSSRSTRCPSRSTRPRRSAPPTARRRWPRRCRSWPSSPRAGWPTWSCSRPAC